MPKCRHCEFYKPIYRTMSGRYVGICCLDTVIGMAHHTDIKQQAKELKLNMDIMYDFESCTDYSMRVD